MSLIHENSDSNAVLKVDTAIGSDKDEYGYERGLLAEWFTDALSYVDGEGKTITCEVNSYGGILKDAKSMFHAVKSAKAYTIGHAIGVAASSASYFLMGFNKVVMNEDAQLMIHEIESGVSGRADVMRKAADTIEKMNESVATVYAGKSGQTVEKVLEMMKEETWMSAWDALELGFCDEVIAFDGTVYTKETANATAKATSSNKALALYMSFKSKINNSNTTMTAEEQKKYDEAVAAQKKAEEKAAALELEKQELENKLAQETDSKIETMLEEAVNTGKITAELKPAYMSLAKKDFDQTKQVLGAMEGRVKLATVLNSAATTQKADERKDWDFHKWSREDEAGLRKMKASDPTRYNTLLNNI